MLHSEVAEEEVSEVETEAEEVVSEAETEEALEVETEEASEVVSEEVIEEASEAVIEAASEAETEEASEVETEVVSEVEEADKQMTRTLTFKNSSCLKVYIKFETGFLRESFSLLVHSNLKSFSHLFIIFSLEIVITNCFVFLYNQVSNSISVSQEVRFPCYIYVRLRLLDDSSFILSQINSFGLYFTSTTSLVDGSCSPVCFRIACLNS